MIEQMFSADLEDVKKALKNGVNINVQSEQNELQCTPLIHALRTGNKDVAKFLIQEGADLSYPISFYYKDEDLDRFRVDITKCSLVECIKHQKDCDILKILLENGAKPNQAERRSRAVIQIPIEYVIGVNLKNNDEDNYSPLTIAVKRRSRAAIEMLIEHGADVNMKDNKGRLPLGVAIENEDPELIKLLLNEGAEFSIQQVLLKAIATENLEIIQILIERGAKLNLKSISGRTPLTYAVQTRNPEVVQLLIDSGADVNLPGGNGDAPLTRAIKLDRIEMVKLLCQNDVDLGRNFPVTTAVDQKNLHILKYLFKMGANFNETGRLRTPLTLAVEEHDFGLVHWLVDRGADVNQVDGSGKTAFSLAVDTKNLRFAKYLQEHVAVVECDSEIKKLADENDDWRVHFENML